MSLIEYSFLDLAYGLPTSEIPPLIPLEKIVLRYVFYLIAYDLPINEQMHVWILWYFKFNVGV